MSKIQLGELYKQRRKDLRITQTDLADLSQVHINTIVQLERGTGNPTLEVLEKVADVLGLQLTLQIKNVTIQT